MIKDKIQKMDYDRKELDEKYKVSKKEKDQLEDKINSISDEVKRHAELQNILLGKELMEKEADFQDKSAKLD